MNHEFENDAAPGVAEAAVGDPSPAGGVRPTGDRRRWIRLALLVSVLCAVAGGAVGWYRFLYRSPDARTVVVISIDTLRHDRVSFAGYQKPTTPFLDGLAERGTVFSRAYSSSSWTPPAMASLMTSLYPASHGVTFQDNHGEGDRGIRFKKNGRLPSQVVCLAEVLKKKGYTTIGAPNNPLLYSEMGFDQGFDLYLEDKKSNQADAFTEYVIREIKGRFGDRWPRMLAREKTLLWVHYLDPHRPLTPYPEWFAGAGAGDRPGRGRLKELSGLEFRNGFTTDHRLYSKASTYYDSEVHRVDAAIRRLWEGLGLGEDVLLVVLSDHGEELGEHGQYGHGKTLYQEVVRIPLFFNWTGRVAAGQRIDEPVSIVDVMPTVLGLLGIASPPGGHGSNLQSVLSGGPGPRNHTVPVGAQANSFPRQLPPLMELYFRDSPDFGLVSNSWKLILHEGSGQSHELYRVMDDPLEARNVASEHPDVVLNLTATLRRAREKLPVIRPEAPDAQLIDQTREKLRAMGYIE